MASFAAAFIAQLFDPAYLCAHPQDAAQTQGVIESQRPNGTALVLDAMRQCLDMSFYLNDFTQPAAVIGGSADVLVPPQAMRDLHEGLPDSTIKLIDGVGHMSPVEAPEEVSFQLDQLMQRAGMWL